MKVSGKYSTAGAEVTNDFEFSIFCSIQKSVKEVMDMAKEKIQEEGLIVRILEFKIEI